MISVEGERLRGGGDGAEVIQDLRRPMVKVIRRKRGDRGGLLRDGVPGEANRGAGVRSAGVDDHRNFSRTSTHHRPGQFLAFFEGKEGELACRAPGEEPMDPLSDQPLDEARLPRSIELPAGIESGVERRDDSPNGHGESVSKSGGKVDGGKKGAMPKRVGNGKGDGYGKEEKRHQPYAEKELGIG